MISNKGFSLLELLVAMTIIALLGTLGFKQYQRYSMSSRHLKAQDDLKIVAEGLDQFYLKYGQYPELPSYESMVATNSPLLKENFIKVGMKNNDPFGQPYQGRASRATYELKYLGVPDRSVEYPGVTRTPSQITSNESSDGISGK
ncbi:MAG: type II secretion system protein [Holophagaceae bacterium]|jgi:prepilin-type N-terminal cleavage/methylation domain-containing protein